MTVVAVEPTVAVLSAVPDAYLLLTDSERGRAARLRRVQDREDYVAAHALVRLCAGRALGVPPRTLTVRQSCDKCGGPHGRPAIAGTHVSLAHSGGMVAAAAGPRPVGVDVERVTGAAVDGALTALALAPAERELVRAAPDPALAFLLLWVRKEALVKLGAADLDSLREIDLSGLPVDPPELPRGLRHGALHLLDQAGPAWVAAFAGAEAPRAACLDELSAPP